jgi:hypothetical protein
MLWLQGLSMGQQQNEQPVKPAQPPMTLEDVAKMIKDNPNLRVAVMSGAGLSVAAGSYFSEISISFRACSVPVFLACLFSSFSFSLSKEFPTFALQARGSIRICKSIICPTQRQCLSCATSGRIQSPFISSQGSFSLATIFQRVRIFSVRCWRERDCF